MKGLLNQTQIGSEPTSVFQLVVDSMVNN